jgi:hypothetical protein
MLREILSEGNASSMVEEHVREVRAHLARMRRADNLLEAYSLPRNAAGIKPSAELAKAKAAHAKAAEGIIESMEALRTCRETDARTIECGANGIEAEEIFCSACGGFESADGNDILLCDLEGCHHAYHQNCVSPALTTDDLDAHDWFCPVCAATLSLLDAVNEYCGEDWEDVASMFPKLRRRLAGEEVSESEEDEPDDDYVDSDRSSEPAHSGGLSPSSQSDDAASDSESAADSALGPRRPRVDYAALAAEMFGEDDDEDADPNCDQDFAPRRLSPTSSPRPVAAPRRKRSPTATRKSTSPQPRAKRRPGAAAACDGHDGVKTRSPHVRAKGAPPLVAVRSRASRPVRKTS